jgi:cytochrome c-type biogenesis protein CcmH/NrfF
MSLARRNPSMLSLSKHCPSSFQRCRQGRSFDKLRTVGLGVTLVLMVSVSTLASAQQVLPPAPYAYTQLADPAKEAEARALMETLRCLQCQGQSIADSDAPIAGDMRHQVRQRIEAGEEPEAVRAWLVERYGDYVSYAPRVTATTWPLYAAPLLLIVLAAVLLRRRFSGARG